MKKLHQYTDVLQQLNAEIWSYAELRFEEKQSSAAMAALLQQQGFSVIKGTGGMETAFTATFGCGEPVIGILAEFDALSGLSQQADVARPVARTETDCGHGCGHSLLGVAALGAALGVRDYLTETSREGTVVLVGCPAEEGGSGKTYLARAGVFDHLDAALTWHPGGGNVVMTGSLQANCQAYFRFRGVSSHAATAPHLGRSALDALELMNVGANYMREHMEPTDRLHYAVLDSGGKSPNVVQSRAEVIYLIRSTDTPQVKKLYERVCNIARGAALMTETEVDIVFDKACSNILSNTVLEKLLYDCMLATGVPEYSQSDYHYARQFRETLTEQDYASDLSAMFSTAASKKQLMQLYKQKDIADFIIDYEHLDRVIPGSSDVGDVSYVTPVAQFVAACFVPGTQLHSWQATAQGKSPIAIKGMMYAAEVLMRAVIRLIDDKALLAQAAQEFHQQTEGQPYQCPIPDEVKPNGGK